MEHDIAIGKDEVGCGDVCDFIVRRLEELGFFIPNGSTEIVNGEKPSVTMHKVILHILKNEVAICEYEELGIDGKPITYREEVIKIIKEHDMDGGARFDTILDGIKRIGEDELEQLLIDLLSEGLIYEPEIHRYKWAN